MPLPGRERGRGLRDGRAGDAASRSGDAPSRSPRSGRAAARAMARRPGRRARSPGSTRPSEGGGSACSTQRTSGLSIPMPNATVAAMMRAEPSRNAVIASCRSRAGQPGVIERHPLACRRRARRVPPVRRRASPRRRSPGQRTRRAAPTSSRSLSGMVRTWCADRWMCGRSKSPITTTGSRRPSRRMISCRTGGAAVAVKRQADRRAERLGLRSEQHVVGAEVAAPLADQMRFVNGEQARPRAPQRLAGLARWPAAPARGRRTCRSRTKRGAPPRARQPTAAS